MLLRRITEHVKEQNWTAVTLDYYIVVVGVLIGIQVSNWNAKRVETATAEAYLVRLQDDISKDVETLERRMIFWDQVIQYGKTAIEFARQWRQS